MADGYHKTRNIENPDDGTRADITPHKKTGVTEWDVLKMEWITTPISLARLAEKYNLSFWMVRQRYYLDRWTDALKDFRKSVKEEYELALGAKAKELADRAATLDQVILSTSEKVVHIIDSEISKLVPNEEGKVTDAVSVETLNELVKAMKGASEALKTSHYNIRLAVDKSTSIVEHKGAEVLSGEEEERISNELGLIKRRNVQSESVPEEESPCVVDGDKSSPDTQK